MVASRKFACTTVRGVPTRSPAPYSAIVSPVAEDEFFFVPDDGQLQVSRDQGVLSNDVDYTTLDLSARLVERPRLAAPCS